MIKALRGMFEGSKGEAVSRRDLLRGALGAAATATLASLPFGKEAEAGGATITDEQARAITHKRHEMQDYAKDSGTQGVGVFINLQEDAPANFGEKLGNAIRKAFAKHGIPVEYRVNRSLGTATDLTFYVGEHVMDVRYPDLKRELPTVYAHHQDSWRRIGDLSMNDRQP